MEHQGGTNNYQGGSHGCQNSNFQRGGGGGDDII